MTRPAPKPLAGLRVVEFEGIGPAPLAAMILADLGADVIRVARPPDTGQAWGEVGGAVLNRNRPWLPLDLKADPQAALALIERADALIEGFRPGVMERLGLGPDVCLARNPRLAYARMTGWGQTGPLARRAGHDINYIALSGALGAMGRADQPPSPPLNLVGDYGGGALFAVVGVLSAVMGARASGRGQVADIAMTDGSAVLTGLFHALMAQGLWSATRGDNLLDGSRPFYRCYACADGRHVAVGALEPAFFAQLLAGLGLPADRFVQYDPAGWPAMEAAFAAAFASRTRDDWAAAFADSDACVTPVLGLDEAPGHPHNRARGTFVDADGVTQPAPAPRFSDAPLAVEPERRTPLSLDGALARWG